MRYFKPQKTVLVCLTLVGPTEVVAFISLQPSQEYLLSKFASATTGNREKPEYIAQMYNPIHY
jgi:hypothetical protein